MYEDRKEIILGSMLMLADQNQDFLDLIWSSVDQVQIFPRETLIEEDPKQTCPGPNLTRAIQNQAFLGLK